MLLLANRINRDRSIMWSVFPINALTYIVDISFPDPGHAFTKWHRHLLKALIFTKWRRYLLHGVDIYKMASTFMKWHRYLLNVAVSAQISLSNEFASIS